MMVVPGHQRGASVSHGQLSGVGFRVPRGTLTPEAIANIDEFWCGVFGWTSRELSWEEQAWGAKCHMLLPPGRQFIQLAESDQPSPVAPEVISDDPRVLPPPLLGVSYDTFEEVDEILDKCLRYREKDPNLKIVDFGVTPVGDVRFGEILCRNLFVLYYIPIWADVNAVRAA
jgi:hypothetical protein